MKFFYFLTLLSCLNLQDVLATEGCLINNTFYTSYIGQITNSNGSFSGSKKVFRQDVNMFAINYSNDNIPNTVKASENGYIPRNGDLCFVMTQIEYNSYPNHVAPVYPWPNKNGTLQNFAITPSPTTNLPLDDYIWLLLLVSGTFACFKLIDNNHKRHKLQCE